jgi:ArsR family transcriptional regulator, arsenate/arsenite/antimonite-responsive transcriptional repressor
VKTTVQIFKALADTNRIRILKMLQSRPLCVCEITAILGLATSTVSKHLSILKAAGLIADRKDSKWVNYELEGHPENEALRDVLKLVRNILIKDKTVTSDAQKTAAVDRNRICGVQSVHSKSRNSP